jgi:ankyrin repeat protein
MPLDDGNFPLSYAIAPGQKEMAQLLLDAGANVDTRFGKMNVLGWSIKNRDVELTRLLCERGAEVEGVLSDEGWTALGLAVSADNISEEILRLLLRFRCSPDLPFTVDGNTTTARELARSRKKQLAVAVFEDLVPTMQSAVVNEMAAEAPQKKSKKDKKDKGSVVEKRRPGSHWTMKDFNDLADLLLPYGTKKKKKKTTVF